MDLFCCEKSSEQQHQITADLDKKLLEDERVLQILMETEENHLTPTFLDKQRSINSSMRRTVVEWMLEVCEEQQCQDEVFPLAVNYMDRFLSVCSISKNQLQLLGTACMFVASKLREPRPLAAKILVSYTDNSITLNELLKFEWLILSKLEWSIICVMPQDFLRHILKKLPVDSIGIDSEMVIKHAKTLIALCAIEINFCQYLPSMIAAASIASALCGVGWRTKSGKSLNDLLTSLKEITGIEEDYLKICMDQIDKMTTPYETDINYNMTLSCTPRPEEFTPPPTIESKLGSPKTAGTPTDVSDVHF